MKIRVLFIAFLSLSFFNTTYCQIKAKTSEGKDVVLYDDGTWQYAEDEDLKEEGKKVFIPVSDTKYTKPGSSKTVFKSERAGYSVWYDNIKWKKTSKFNEDQEAQFQLKNGDAYVMSIAEGVEIPIETLGDIAIKNAENASPNVRVTHKEYRNVNGTDVLHMRLEGTLQGINFIYYGYYFSNKGGSVQLVGYTSANLFDKYKKDLEDFLNGFVAEAN
jgi:hypothetical protein